MDGVQATDESLDATRRALEKWFDEAVGISTQCEAQVSAVEQAVEERMRQNRRRATTLQALINSSSDEARVAELRSELARVDSNAKIIRRALSSVSQAQEAARSIGRWLRSSGSARVNAATTDIKRKSGALESYRGSQIGSNGWDATGSSSQAGGARGGVSGGAGIYPSNPELVDVDLATVDFSDNPIKGEFGRGGATEADYRWAVENWETVVRPGVQRGMTRDDFARRDADRGASGFRQTARVYEIFMGTDRIVLSPNGNGTYNVTNGRHRIAAARSLGIRKLPGTVR